jgi:hypothetical protein
VAEEKNDYGHAGDDAITDTCLEANSACLAARGRVVLNSYLTGDQSLVAAGGNMRSCCHCDRSSVDHSQRQQPVIGHFRTHLPA